MEEAKEGPSVRAAGGGGQTEAEEADGGLGLRAFRLKTAACMPRKGEHSSTGESLPPAQKTPWRSNVFHAVHGMQQGGSCILMIDRLVVYCFRLIRKMMRS